jgi:toxin ParE1/3/4
VKVIVTEAAWADMLAIAQFIQRDNPPRAQTFLEELYDRCQRIGVAPLAFPLIQGHEDSGVRRRSFGNYLIFYRIATNAIEILHVVHGARDYERILFPRG